MNLYLPGRRRDNSLMLGRVVLAVAGTTIGALTLQVVLRDSGFSVAADDPQSRVLLLVAGLAPIASGVWSFAGPGARSRLGVLLVLVGSSWLAAAWNDPAVGSDAAFTIGRAAYVACPPFVAHLLFAYPSGRVGSRVNRLLVAVGYASAIGVVGIVATLFYDPAAAGCEQCPNNLALVSNDPAMFTRALREGSRLAFVWSLAAFGWGLWRFLRSSPVRRRDSARVVVPSLAFLSATTLMFGSRIGAPYPGGGLLERRLWEVQGMFLVTLAAGTAWALVTVRARRRELARLIVDLDLSAGADDLRKALAELLGDRHLDIGYPLTGGGYVDATGRPLQATVAEGSATTVLTHAGRAVAMLVHRAGLLDDPRLVEGISSAAYLGLDYVRLRAETRRQLADIRASRIRIVTAGDEERRRLERDLHDGAQQRVVGLALAVGLLRNATDIDSAVLLRAEKGIRSALDELRDLAQGIYPVVLAEEGLTAALEGLAESAGLRVRQAPADRFPAEIETTAYQLVAAATASGPTTVSITATDASLTIDVLSSDVTVDLRDVADRIDALGGHVAVEPSSDRCRVLVRLPLELPFPEE
jgi:signal transduction histidine kinase